jgi:hypothetical protein
MRDFIDYTLSTILWAALVVLTALYPIALGIQIARAATAA